MKNVLKLFVLFLFSVSTMSFAADLGTPEEAIAMVKSAVAYAKANGNDKVISAANDPAGQFVKKDMYIVIHDMTGTVLANPMIPKMIGKNLIDIKDSDGKTFIKDRLAILKTKDDGWIEFKWPNSVTKQIEKRATYFERHGDLVFTCGILKK